ncbi:MULTISPECIES: hypothetical protein [Streptomyces]|uniref:Uncharacterized protein n=1 Tax=Streptomyces rimosus subsp. rimosus (strain ATCC 10970 / DSM 40260 / JCM 4667 / NRRL 2234) TaxID=1265868 RepID=A0A8A1UXJ7_STRR1|nr:MULTISPECIES: hypothetical protein [Streptomyces]KOG75018.1 hypothetical protein ADK78_13765 [Kitasatospora aureofaciens]MYT41769.1 hypothetical protein [Streptomyces sp. SID5471]KOT41815.1 hypothetical protein ADK84_10795 [Streptomyces sp. NRRL WC-3701]KOT43971.1 hypothetical protein ADK42_06580 [Streptomyces rimosus subsp. rimosus]KOT67309.1 hypothetical protein ADK44_03965 [Streptomyces rimosus subsp. rimosus]
MFEHAVDLAEHAPDTAAFWAGRPAFTRLLLYFHRVQRAADRVVPQSMSLAYGRLPARGPKATAAT